MPDISELVPVFQETVDRIRARVNADANAGLAPTDPAFMDATPGGIFADVTGSLILEIDRLWDATGSEMVSAMFPAYAWGTYLDEHGITVGLVRKDAVAAAGTVTFTGTVGTFIGTGVQVAVPQASPDATPAVYQTTAPATVGALGTVDVPITARESGTAGNAAAGAVTVLLSPVDGIASLTNAQAVSGGADVESDEAFRDRILLSYQGATGSGTVADYESWSLAYPGVGNVTVDPLWNGAGTVRVKITDAENRPVASSVVTGLQTLLDPVAGQGRGLAPIGATVTVVTPTTVTVNIAATLSLDAGYSLTGSSGTIPVGADVTASVTNYVNSLPPGASVILQHVIARFFEVAGVHDASSVTLNGSATNLTIGSTQVAVTGTVTLS